MSAAPLRLSPPPDYTKTLLPLTVGIGIALVVFTLTRSTLPAVGDPLHSLPHGGRYRDGTKSILYQPPQSHTNGFLPLLAVLLVSLAIYVSSVLNNRGSNRHCTHCGAKH